MFGWLRRDRYELVLHGMESGNVVPFPFLRFKTEKEADECVQKMNRAHHGEDPNPLTMWDYREIK